MPRKKEQEQEATKKPVNVFAALSMDSSDDEQEVVDSAPPVAAAPPAAPAAPVAPAAPASPPFRTFGAETRKFQDQTIFSSPFNKNRRQRSKPQEDEHGWVSLKPQLIEEPEERPVSPLPAVVYEPRTPPWFPEGAKAPEVAEMPEIVLEDQIAPDRAEGSALVWAERIKKSLEKAESARAAKATASKGIDEEFKEALGRLSFFRRPMAVTEEKSSGGS